MPRRNLAIRPVQSLKHIVDVASSVVLAVQTVIPVIESGINPSLTTPTQVNEGSTVNAIYLRAEVLPTGVYAGVPRVYMSVFKEPGTGLNIPDPNNSGINSNKRYIIHQEMTMVNNPGADGAVVPRTMFQGVVRIPPRLKRFGYSDRLLVVFQNGTGETSGIANVCIQCIYKEYQ